MTNNNLLTKLDLYERYWKCRDFELTTLWQRGVFLGPILVMFFTGYLIGNSRSVVLVLNIIGFLGIISSTKMINHNFAIAYFRQRAVVIPPPKSTLSLDKFLWSFGFLLRL